jgi:hypothetical protein
MYFWKLERDILRFPACQKSPLGSPPLNAAIISIRLSWHGWNSPVLGSFGVLEYGRVNEKTPQNMGGVFSISEESPNGVRRSGETGGVAYSLHVR